MSWQTRLCESAQRGSVGEGSEVKIMCSTECFPSRSVCEKEIEEEVCESEKPERKRGKSGRRVKRDC